MLVHRSTSEGETGDGGIFYYKLVFVNVYFRVSFVYDGEVVSAVCAEGSFMVKRIKQSHA